MQEKRIRPACIASEMYFSNFKQTYMDSSFSKANRNSLKTEERFFHSCTRHSHTHTPPHHEMQVMKWSLFLWVCKACRSQSCVIYIAECSANPVRPQSCLAQGRGSGNWKPDTEGIPNTVLKLKTALSAWHVLHESQGLYSFTLSDFSALYCW